MAETKLKFAEMVSTPKATEISVEAPPPVEEPTFAKMLAACPQDVSAYGACLRQKVAEGQLEKGACEVQFAALARCFAKSRAKR